MVACTYYSRSRYLGKVLKSPVPIQDPVVLSDNERRDGGAVNNAEQPLLTLLQGGFGQLAFGYVFERLNCADYFS